MKCYLRWVAANALAATISIGAPILMAWSLSRGLHSATSDLSIASIAIVVIITGTALGGLFTGPAQWWGLDRKIARLSVADWSYSVVIGSAFAWLTVVAIAATFQIMADSPWRIGSRSAPPGALVLAIGFVLGLVFSLPQWLVLRQHVEQAWWWLYGNVFAWIAGCATIAIAMPAIPLDRTFAVAAMVCGGAFLFSLIVAAINGVFLFLLLDGQPRQSRDLGARYLPA